MSIRPARVNLYLVDDDDGVRGGLAAQLVATGHPVQAFGSGEAFLAAVPANEHGCVLLDQRMGGMSGLEVLKALRARGSRLRVLFLSAHGDVRTSIRAMHDGAADWLEKPPDPHELLAKVKARLAEAARIADATERWAALTDTEREVGPWVAAGFQNKEVGRILGKDPRTIETQRAKVFDKTGTRNAVELALFIAEFELAAIPRRADADPGGAPA